MPNERNAYGEAMPGQEIARGIGDDRSRLPQSNAPLAVGKMKAVLCRKSSVRISPACVTGTISTPPRPRRNRRSCIDAMMRAMRRGLCHCPSRCLCAFGQYDALRYEAARRTGGGVLSMPPAQDRNRFRTWRDRGASISSRNSWGPANLKAGDRMHAVASWSIIRNIVPWQMLAEKVGSAYRCVSAHRRRT